MNDYREIVATLAVDAVRSITYDSVLERLAASPISSEIASLDELEYVAESMHDALSKASLIIEWPEERDLSTEAAP